MPRIVGLSLAIFGSLLVWAGAITVVLLTVHWIVRVVG